MKHFFSAFLFMNLSVQSMESFFDSKNNKKIEYLNEKQENNIGNIIENQIKNDDYALYSEYNIKKCLSFLKKIAPYLSNFLFDIINENNENFIVSPCVGEASCIFIDQKYIKNDYFIDNVKKIDFKNRNAIEKINTWCADKTNNLIPQIVQEIDPDTVIMLLTSLFVDTKWEGKYEEESLVFYNKNRTKKNIRGFKAEDGFDIIENNDVSFVRLKGKNNIYLYIKMPKNESDLAIKKSEIYNFLPQELKTFYEVYIPDFKFEVEYDLLSLLKNEYPFLIKKMITVFNEQDPVKIDQFKQKNMIQVTKEGVRAASITVASFVNECAFFSSAKKVFIDHPFGFAITHTINNKENIIFNGFINNISNINKIDVIYDSDE